MCDTISVFRCVMILGMLACSPIVSGCQPNDAPLKAENEALKKQVAKQESLLSSLQDGNRVMQQQIDLLNQELRDAKQATERLTEQHDEHLAHIQQTAAQALQLDEKGVQFDTVPGPLPAVAKVVEDALSRNGYHLKVGAQMGQKAVYVTERKVSHPASLEVAGFRNQYFVSLQATPGNGTKLGVKAEIEKLAQGGRVLNVNTEERVEIERSLISEIQNAFKPSGKT